MVQTVIETAPKGANLVLEWRRNAKTRKGVLDLIQKDVRMVGRVGIDYDRIGAVQAKRESGELPSTPQSLPWGKWEVFPFLIEHKGNYYVRLYNGTSPFVTPRVRWFRNGVEVSFENVEGELLAAEKNEKDGDCFTVKMHDLLRIGKDTDYASLPEITGSITTTSDGGVAIPV